MILVSKLALECSPGERLARLVSSFVIPFLPDNSMCFPLLFSKMKKLFIDEVLVH